MRSRHETGKTETEIEEEFEQKKQDLQANLQDQLSNTVKTFIETSTQDVVETVEKKIKEREKTGIEDSVRDHLRGFSRTIPSFLMAYGNDTVTLATFDVVIPNPVFLEVTSITLDQFRFLRDGGKYKDAETGEEKEFAGNLFDPVIFDDSVKKFLRLKKKLADYSMKRVSRTSSITSRRRRPTKSSHRRQWSRRWWICWKRRIPGASMTRTRLLSTST